MKIHRLIACFLLLLASATVSSAKAWRGIVPLHSTRADVERILGKPTRFDYIYDFDEGTVEIMYVKQRCEQGVPSGWGNWNVPPDTVINISVEVDIPVRKLKVRNLEQYKWYTDDSLTTYYRLPAEGLEYHQSPPNKSLTGAARACVASNLVRPEGCVSSRRPVNSGVRRLNHS